MLSHSFWTLWVLLDHAARLFTVAVMAPFGVITCFFSFNINNNNKRGFSTKVDLSVLTTSMLLFLPHVFPLCAWHTPATLNKGRSCAFPFHVQWETGKFVRHMNKAVWGPQFPIHPRTRRGWHHSSKFCPIDWVNNWTLYIDKVNMLISLCLFLALKSVYWIISIICYLSAPLFSVNLVRRSLISKVV